MSNAPFEITEARTSEIPLLVSVPHTGTAVPAAIDARFAGPGVRELPDTDWHLHDLYDFVPDLGATLLTAVYSRYVIDLNRPREAQNLYPGRFETTLVPTRSFADEAIYRSGAEPDATEISERIELFWQPYHDEISTRLAALRERFGYALLFDAHSITSVVPQFYDGQLPGLMLGDVDGSSAAGACSDAVLAVLEASPHSAVRNAPFKGGYITRCFGQPQDGIHALQLEMSQRLYMDEGSPFAYREDLAEALRPTLRAALLAFVESAATR